MGLCWPLEMPPSAKAVLISLADQANDAGVCWPAIGTICKRTCLSERTVQSAISWLRASGVLLVNRSPGRSTNYQINPAGFGAGTAPLFDAPVRGDAGQTPANAAPRSSRTPQQSHPTPAAAAPTPANAAPRSVKNRQGTTKKKFDAVAIDLPSWLDAALWAKWVKDRKVRGNPVTEDAAQIQLSKLAGFMASGFSPTEVIEHSISGGYQGLFCPTKRVAGTPIDPDAKWWETGNGIQAKAKEIGFAQWSDELDATGHVEPHPHYLARLRKAVAEREGATA